MTDWPCNLPVDRPPQGHRGRFQKTSHYVPHRTDLWPPNAPLWTSQEKAEPPDSPPLRFLLQEHRIVTVRLMDQTDLIEKIAVELHIPKNHTQRLLRATLREIRDILTKGEAITIPQWGTFDTAIHEPRRGFLPSGFLPLGKGYAIFPKRRVPVFRAGKSLHDDVYDLDTLEEGVSA